MKEKKNTESPNQKSVICGFSDLISVEGLSEKIFDLIENVSFLIFYRSIADHRIAYTNAYFSRIFNLPVEELRNKDYRWTDFIAPSDKERYFRFFEELKTPKYVLEYRLIDGSGQPLWVQEKGTVLSSENPKEAMVLGFINEISERKKIEERLIGSEEQLNLALMASQMGLWDWDIPNKRYTGNGFWTRMLGFKPGTFATDEFFWMSIIHPDDLDRTLRAIEDHLSGKTDQFFMEYRVRTNSGDWKWVWDQGKIISFDESGLPKRMVGTIVDITALKEAQAELLSAKAAAEKASRQKTELLASVNHDLKTPLTVILGAAETLLQESENASKPMLEMIRSNAKRLQKMVGNLLEISQIESGRLILTPSTVRTKRFFDDCESNYTQLAKEKNLSFEQRIAQNVPKTLIFDLDRFLKVLNNLVENAVKYTLEGSVRLEIQYAPEEIGPSQRRNRGGHLQVAVSDTGIGIPSEYLPAIFDRFFRVPSKRSRSIVSGSGLGLAICRELVEQMGGAISVRSVENEGTTFEFSIYVKEGNGAL